MTTRKSAVSVPQILADDMPAPEAFRCVSILVPDDDAAVRVLAGLVALTTNTALWWGEQENREIQADLWLAAYTATDWDGCMDCAGVQDCIENDAGVQGAIDDRIQNLYQPTSPNTPIPAGIASGNLVPDTDCDFDELWGAIDNLIENMNINNQDMQQIIESGTNLGERVAKLISGVPGVGLLPFDEAIDYAQTLLTNDVFEAYLAADTTEYRNEIKCGLFCLAKAQDCQLSLDDVGTYFAERLTTNWADTFSDVLVFLAAGVWTGTEINDTFYYIQAQALAKTNKFFAMLGLPNFGVYMATGTATDDWIALCEECPDFGEILQFSVPINFGGSQIALQVFTPGEAMVFESYNLGGSRESVCIYAPNGDYDQAYTISPDPVNAPGLEICWLYVDLSDGTQLATGAAETADDFPTPVDVRHEQGSTLKCSWWHADEPFTITVTLT